MKVIVNVPLHTGNVSNRQLGVNIREAAGSEDGQGIELNLTKEEEKEILGRSKHDSIVAFFEEFLPPPGKSLQGRVFYYPKNRIVTTDSSS